MGQNCASYAGQIQQKMGQCKAKAPLLAFGTCRKKIVALDQQCSEALFETLQTYAGLQTDPTTELHQGLKK